MQVAELADLVAGSRCTDGTVSLPMIQSKLSSAGLDELAYAAARLVRRLSHSGPETIYDPEHPWI